jgi:hypothetical protein
LKEVVEEPQAIIEAAQDIQMSLGIEAAIADISPDQAVVVLFGEAVVVFLKGAAARESQLWEFLVPLLDQELVEELGIIIGVDLQHLERQASEEKIETIGDHPKAAPEYGHELAPAGGNIEHLEAVDIFSIGSFSTVVDQIDFNVIGFVDVPGDLADRKLFEQAVRLRAAGFSPRKFGFAAAHSTQDPPERGNAEAGEFLFRFGCKCENGMSFQVMRHPDQVRLQLFGTWIIQAE